MGVDTTQRVDVYLVGYQADADRELTSKRLAALFRKDVAAVEKMLAKGRHLLKKDADESLANKYRASIEKAGGRCELVSKSEPITQSPSAIVAAPIPPTVPAPSFADKPLYETSARDESARGEQVYRAPTAELDIKPTAFCRQCGTSIDARAVRCPNCNAVQTVGTSKSKTTAAVLAFFLGGLGAHRFYLGQWWGVFYLLFWGTLIPSLVSIIETIVFIATPQERWQRKYGNVNASSAGMMVVAVVGVFVCVAVIGILAAIALPAYQDYTIRAKVVSAMPLVHETQGKVSMFIRKTRFYPNQNVDAGLPETINSDVVESLVLLEGGKMQLTLRTSAVNRPERTLEWVPVERNDAITWNCVGGSLETKYRPAECRSTNSNGAAETSGGNGKAEASESSIKPAPARLQTLRSKDGHLSVQVPAIMKTQERLHEAALIQAANPERELYFIVLDESKQDFAADFSITRYADAVIAAMQLNLRDASVIGDRQTLTINQLPAEQVVLTGAIDGIDVTYLITVVSGQQNYYQLLSWTLAPRFDSQRETFERIAQSFSEQVAVSSER